MNVLMTLLRRFALTGAMMALALWSGYKLWDYYFDEPWTRDGHVRADVVPIAPDVSGFVTDVLVKDNQRVRRGDVLFRIDRARYAIAQAQAEAVLEGRRAMLEQANADLKRPTSPSPSRSWIRSSPHRVRQKQPTTRPLRTSTLPNSTLSAVRYGRPSMASSPTWN